jgi:hypothetical protein
MMRLAILSILFAALCCSPVLADDWDWEDVTKITLPKPNGNAQPHDHSDDAEESEPAAHDEEGQPLNFGSYFGSGEEFIESNVSYDRGMFITITDVPVDARSGQLDELIYEDDAEPALESDDTLPLADENADRPDNVYGPLYGVPDDAVGLDEYDAEDYGGMEPGDEDVPDEAPVTEDEDADSGDESVDEESFEDEDAAEQPADDEAADEESGEGESEEEGHSGEELSKEEAEKAARERDQREPRKHKPEEWWEN